MTKKDFAKWQKDNPITFMDGVNGLCGFLRFDNFTYSVCGSNDQTKRKQKTYIKERLYEKILDLLEKED